MDIMKNSCYGHHFMHTLSSFPSAPYIPHRITVVTRYVIDFDDRVLACKHSTYFLWYNSKLKANVVCNPFEMVI